MCKICPIFLIGLTHSYFRVLIYFNIAIILISSDWLVSAVYIQYNSVFLVKSMLNIANFEPETWSFTVYYNLCFNIHGTIYYSTIITVSTHQLYMPCMFYSPLAFLHTLSKH